MTFEERVEAVLKDRIVNHEEAIELAWKRVGESNLARCYLDLCRQDSVILTDRLGSRDPQELRKTATEDTKELAPSKS